MYISVKILLLISCPFTYIYSETSIGQTVGVTKLGTCRAKLDDGTIIDLSKLAQECLNQRFLIDFW